MSDNNRAFLLILSYVLEAAAQILKRIAGPSAKQPERIKSLLDSAFDHFRDAGAEPNRMTFDGEYLRWGDMAWPAVSGPHRKGFLPDGTYAIDWKHCTDDKSLGAPYRIGDVAFWVPLVNSPQADDAGRRGFGIHPDGNVPGTAGCVGIQPAAGEDSVAHCRSFWEKVKATPLAERPRELEVWQPCWVKGSCPV